MILVPTKNLYIPSRRRQRGAWNISMTRDPPAAGGGAAGFTPDSGFDASGSFEDGQLFTISKANAFQAKPNGAKPLWFWFPGKTGSTSLDTDSRSQAWNTDTGNGPQFGSIQSNQLVTGSNFSYEIIASNSTQAGCIDGLAISSVNLYLFAKWRTNWNGVDAFAAGPSDWNFKGWRWWYTSFTHDLKTGYGSNLDSTDNPVLFYENTDPGSNFDGWSPAHAGIPKNTWLTEEYEVHQSDLNVSNGFTRVYQGGRQVGNYTGITRNSGNSQLYNRFYAHQFERMNTLSSWRLWYDTFYLDDSFSRVILADASSWSTSSLRSIEVQPVIAWSTDSLTFRVRKGAFASLVGKYVYSVQADRTTIVRCGVGAAL